MYKIIEYNVLHLSQAVLQRQIPEPSSEGPPVLMFGEILYLSRFLPSVSALTNSAIFVFLKVCKLTLRDYFNWLPALWKYERQRFYSGLPLIFLKSFHSSLCYSPVQRSFMGSSAVTTSCNLSSLVHLLLVPQCPGIKWLIYVLVFAHAERPEPPPTQINDLGIYLFTYGFI